MGGSARGPERGLLVVALGHDNTMVLGMVATGQDARRPRDTLVGPTPGHLLAGFFMPFFALLAPLQPQRGGARPDPRGLHARRYHVAAFHVLVRGQCCPPFMTICSTTLAWLIPA